MEGTYFFLKKIRSACLSAQRHIFHPFSIFTGKQYIVFTLCHTLIGMTQSNKSFCIRQMRNQYFQGDKIRKRYAFNVRKHTFLYIVRLLMSKLTVIVLQEFPIESDVCE